MTVTSEPLVYDPYEYEIHEDPYPTYAAPARRGAAVPQRRAATSGRCPATPTSWTASATTSASRPPTACRSTRPPPGPHAHQTMSFLAMDPPQHGRMRGLVSRGFTPRRVAELEPRIRELTVRAPRRRAGARARSTSSATSPASCRWTSSRELIGVPEADRDELRRLSDLLVHREEGVHDVPPAGVEAAFALVGYYADMLAERRATPTDDLTSALLDAEVDGDRLTDDEIMGFLFLMVVAGNETTTKLLGNAWYWAWRNPDERAKPFADPSRIADWVEETLRYDTSSQMLARITTEDVELHGTDDPRRRPGRCCSPARPTATSASSPTPTRYDLDRPTRARRSPASASAATSAWAPRWPGSRRASCLEELVARVADYDIDPAGIRRVHSRQRPRLRQPLPTTVERSADAAVHPHPERRAGRSSPARRPGIGAATAPALAAAGHPVVLGARRVERLEEAAAKIARRRRRGGRACRSTSPTTRRSTRSPTAAEAQLGPIEVVVSNAGEVAARPPALGADPDDFARQVHVNLLGAQRLVRAPRPGDGRARQRGDIVFVTSDVVRRAPHLHGRLRRRQDRPRGPGPRHADGARGHRRAGRHRAPRPLDHRAGHRPGARRPSTR